MERKTFYGYPMQVAWLDYDGCTKDHIEWKGGIAHNEEIICGCCGGTINIKELWEDWDNWAKEEFGDFVDSPIREYEYWVDISNEIKG